jgi:hypothetical protein
LKLKSTLSNALADAKAKTKAFQLRDLKELTLLQHLALEVKYMVATS